MAGERRDAKWPFDKGGVDKTVTDLFRLDQTILPFQVQLLHAITYAKMGNIEDRTASVYQMAEFEELKNWLSKHTPSAEAVESAQLGPTVEPGWFWNNETFQKWETNLSHADGVTCCGAPVN